MKVLLLTVAVAVCHISFAVAYPAGESKVLETLEQLNGKEGIREKEAFEYMRKFGYLNKPPQAMTWADYEVGVMRMQKMLGVPQTAILDDATYEVMQKPRCGVPDGHVYSLDDERDWEEETHSEGFGATSLKWKKRDLSFKVLNYKDGLNTYDFDKAVFNGLKIWTDVTSLTATPTKCSAIDIKISFNADFPDATSILARARLPTHGTVEFNSLTTWASRPASRAEGFSMELVTAHEFGHALGLVHSEVRDSIMYPAYPFNQDMAAYARLTQDDIDGIRKMYGDQNTPYAVPSPIDPACVDTDKQIFITPRKPL